MSGYTCIRCSLCFLNLLVWIAGCGVLGVGIWILLSYQGYSAFMPTYRLLSADCLAIIAGSTAVLVAFCGCCGAWFKNKCLLRCYFAVVIIMLLLEFTAGILGFIYRKNVGEMLQDELTVGLKSKYSLIEDTGLVETWDHIQKNFECCGVKSVDDWYRISAWPKQEWVPNSCCRPRFSEINDCGKMKNETYWYDQGCYDMLHNWVMKRLYIGGIICTGLAFIQLFGIISAAIVISCTLKKKSSYKKW